MTAAKVLFMPARLAASVCCLAVTSLFAASGSIGWYYVWASQRIEPYKSENRRATMIAVAQGVLCVVIVCESTYGFLSLLSNRKGLIRWYLWFSWITFFLGCIATAGTAVLIWVFRFGETDCTTSPSGQVACNDLDIAIKIILTVVSALGCWVLSYMPTVLRLVYSRFAAQEALSDKLGEPDEEAPLPVDHEYEPVQEAPEMDADPQVHQLINKPSVDM